MQIGSLIWNLEGTKMEGRLDYWLTLRYGQTRRQSLYEVPESELGSLIANL